MIDFSTKDPNTVVEGPSAASRQRDADLTQHVGSDVPLSSVAQVRATCYEFFSTLFLYPDAPRRARLGELVKQLESADKLLAAFAFYAPLRKLSERVSLLSSEQLDELAVKYPALFSSGHGTAWCQPYESTYLTQHGRGGQLAGRLQFCYDTAGLHLREFTNELPDHVSVELRYMALLCERESESWATADASAARRALEYERRFLNEHLLRWLPSFASQVAFHDRGGTFAIASEATVAFVRHDLDLLNPLLGSLKLLEFNT